MSIDVMSSPGTVMMKWRFLNKNEGYCQMGLIWRFTKTKLNLLNHIPIDLILIQYVTFYGPLFMHDV